MADTVEVVVGVIGRAHGVLGEVAVELRTDEPDRRFAPGQQLRAEDTPRFFTVLTTRTSCRWAAGEIRRGGRQDDRRLRPRHCLGGRR